MALAVWLALVGRVRAAARRRAVAAGASLLLLVPFIGIGEYARLLRRLGDTFEHETYTPVRAADGLGLPDTAARVATGVVGLGVLALAWRRRSLGLAIAAALVLSPIVWRHFFVLLLVPLALSRPRFDAVWLIPIGLWVGDGTFNGAPWQTACVLALVALTFALCELRPRASTSRIPRPGPRIGLKMTAARRLVPILLFAVLPIVRRDRDVRHRELDRLARRGLQNELYPEAKLLLDWTNPFPGPDAALEHGHNFIWPPVAAFLIAPLTALPAAPPTGSSH